MTETKSELYYGFEISWQELPLTSAKWTANVASNDRDLYDLMCRHRAGQQGAEPVDGNTRDDMLAKARAFVDRIVR